MKSYIWGLPTRIFHWLLAIAFITAFTLGETDNANPVHFACGIFIGVLLIFRIIYGIIGPKYSNFRDFPVGSSKIAESFKNLKKLSSFYPGHNSLAALTMLAIMIVGLLCSISGLLIYLTEQKTITLAIGEDFLEDFHGTVAGIFLTLVILHILGLINETIFDKDRKTWKSIFTGYKQITAENSSLSLAHKIFAVLWFIVPLFFFFSALKMKPLEQEKENEGHEQKTEHIRD